MARIGFMQGRLSPQIEGRIQAFPWQHWEHEFVLAQGAGFDAIEWTLDQDRLRENPLVSPASWKRVRDLSEDCGVAVTSLTGDCFMQAPFWKASGAERQHLLDDCRIILDGCAAVGVRLVVVPLVDNGRLETDAHRDALLEGLLPLIPWLQQQGIAIIFESDFAPTQLAALIASLPHPSFGINYDIGNSAALGFDPATELLAYGERVRNVHVKDRLLGGTTVALGTGAADFPAVFRALARIPYHGDFILQTARAPDGDHIGALVAYREMVRTWLAVAHA